MKNKKAVSLMLSYVILISIVIGLSVGVYAWLKTMSVSPEAVDCSEGTSVILEDYTCHPDGYIELNLKNNGRFNVTGIILSVGDNPQQVPITYLIPQITGGVIEGHYQFPTPLKPGQNAIAVFTNKEYDVNRVEQEINFQNIEVIQIQPFIIQNSKRINCQQSVIKQEINNCQVKL